MDDVKRYLDRILSRPESKKNNHTRVGNNVKYYACSSSSIRIRFFQTLMLLPNKIFA